MFALYTHETTQVAIIAAWPDFDASAVKPVAVSLADVAAEWRKVMDFSAVFWQGSSCQEQSSPPHHHHPTHTQLTVISLLQAALLPLNTPGQKGWTCKKTHTRMHTHKQISEDRPIY